MVHKQRYTKVTDIADPKNPITKRMPLNVIGKVSKYNTIALIGTIGSDKHEFMLKTPRHPTLAEFKTTVKFILGDLKDKEMYQDYFWKVEMPKGAKKIVRNVTC